ncbi:hypothetical protein [[Flexibacter] sp. ATCC 35208]|uniref:hypothetical protein n=1 Tax=[Flexibacter] sp. ATCC 35208 TaxID=1936242 RepID=UPI0009D50E83|nr:hypothetical protein [[Flexibacter] sp. ATCC 35208]OMP75125.1 hypothetical protein BW716_31840 [[Flexibacter] sp. ATCC 35208]
MFSNPALDAFIGLIFIYLLYSLLASVLTEFYAQMFKVRAGILKKSIYWMLNDDRKDKNSLAAEFYAYPLIKYLAKAGNQKLPAYFTADNFSQTLIAVLRGDHFDQTIPQMELIRSRLFAATNPANTGQASFVIREETRKYLKMLWVNAANDIDKFKLSLEKWFNDSQDRTTGWYKRRTQWVTLIIGLGIAIAGNVNSIAIAHLLLKDKSAREQMVNLATGNYKQSGADSKQLGIATDEEAKAINGRLNDDINLVQLTLGLGYGKIEPDVNKEKKLKAAIENDEKRFDVLVLKVGRDSTIKTDTLKNTLKQIENGKAALNDYYTHISLVKKYQGWFLSPIGWLLTAFAVSLGAPFWFDLLNKIIQLRGTGPKPVPSTSNTKDGSTTVPETPKRKG